MTTDIEQQTVTIAFPRERRRLIAHARIISHKLKLAGFVITSGYKREGIRVKHGLNSVDVVASFDSETRAMRFSKEIADVLKEAGYVVEQSGILVIVTGKVNQDL